MMNYFIYLLNVTIINTTGMGKYNGIIFKIGISLKIYQITKEYCAKTKAKISF